MPHNKNALIRYRTIDQCLCMRQKRWTLENLIEACTEALYEYEGFHQSVSKRTTQLDIQNMRSGKLGYFAPIVVVDRKYYTYSNPDFSISNLPLTETDLGNLSEALDVLKQFKGFSHFEELEGMVKKLEDKIDVARQLHKAVIHMDRNEQFKGLEFLDNLYQSILKKEVLSIKYHPFGREEAAVIKLHPYLLKEYNNRWYVMGFHEHKRRIATLGLDRIVELKEDGRTPFIENNFFNPEIYFKEVIGITVDFKSQPTEVILYIKPNQAPYVLTKPLHNSQKVIRRIDKGLLISLKVRINYELLELIRSMGKEVMVVEPDFLREQIQKDLIKSLQQYQDEDIFGMLTQNQ